MSKRSVLISITSMFGLLLPSGPAFASTEASIAGNEIVPGQAIIRVDESVMDPTTALEELGYEVIQELGPEDQNTFVVELDPFLATSRQIGQLAVNEDLVFAEPNYLYSIGAVSNDSLVVDGSLWGMQGPSTTPANQYGSNAAAAWGAGYTGNSNVYVAVLDSGIDYEHPDLAANVWTNTGEVAGDGLDNDGNGFVDDIHGYDFVEDDGSVFDADENYHGTHVAGTIGAVGGNGVGVAGVAWNVKLISAKMIGTEGTATTSSAIQAIDYVTMLRTKKGLDIIAMNASWGGDAYSAAMEQAIQRGGDAGIAFIAAAGNGDELHNGQNLDVGNSYPAEMDCKTKARDWDCIVAVAAIDSSGDIASFSDYSATRVDIAAPGVGVVSTYPDISGETVVHEYRSLSGTSMAAPHVAGALALCVSSYRGTSAEIAIQKLLSTAAATSSLSGKVASDGRLDVGALVTSCVSDTAAFSGAHTDVYASAIYTNQIRLDWTDSVVGDFEQEIQIASGPSGCTGSFSHFAFIGPGLTSYPITGLEESQFYCFKIRSNNSTTLSNLVKSNVSITWTSNLPFVYGKVLLSDGVTAVANAPVKWVASGQFQSISTSGVVVRSDAGGNYVMQVSDGTAGILSIAQTITSSKPSLMTDPVTPWGLTASGELTVEQDTILDLTLPPQHTVTFSVTDDSGPVVGAKLGWEGLAKYCVDDRFTFFEGATENKCSSWPFGTSSSNLVTDSSGNVTIAFPDSSLLSTNQGSYVMSVANPTTPGQIASFTYTPTESETKNVVMPEVTTISGKIFMSDASTAVSGIEVHWLTKGQYDDSNNLYAASTTTDSSGNYTLPASVGVAGKLYASTTRTASNAAATTPRVPWGLEAGGKMTISGTTTTDLVLPEQNIANLTVTDFGTSDPVALAKVQYSGLAEYCRAGTYTAFDGATESDCSSWPTGYSSGLGIRTNSSGQASLALLDNSYFSTNRSNSFSVTDPYRTSRVAALNLDLTQDENIAVQMPGPVTISGKVFLADGQTVVAGAPVKWVADSQYSSGGYSAAQSTTAADGSYSLEVSVGTPGELYVEVTRDARNGATTSPQLPWGLHAGGDITASTDLTVNLVMPEQNLVTITAREMSSSGQGDPIEDATIKFEGLANYCRTGTYSPFAGATNGNCTFWPAGYSHSSPRTNASGVAVIPVLAARYFNSNSYTFSVFHPMDVARVESVTLSPSGDVSSTLVLPGTPSQPEQPTAVAGDGSVSLTWTEPWNGGAFIDYYQVWVSLSAEGPFELVTTGSCAGQIAPELRACVVEGLTPGVTYYFAIIAKNAVGYSDMSISVASVPTEVIQDLTLTPTPTISGTISVDQTVTAAAGTWDAGVTLGYQWRRDGAGIAGANSATYLIKTADIGAALSVSVTGTKEGYNPVTSTSTSTIAVTAGTLTLTPTPTISGTSTDGETLVATAGAWDSGVALSYQWLRAGEEISLATTASYQLTSSDVGAAISVRVTGTKSGYSTVAKTSAATNLVAEAAPVVQALSDQTLHPTPTISGDAIVGETLTANVGDWDSGVTLAYRWLRNDAPITGETALEYTLSAADAGSVISFEVISSKASFVTLSEVSSAVGPVTTPVTAMITSPTYSLTPTPTISGGMSVGSTLTANIGTWDEGVILSYQWLADGVAVFGATGLTYQIGAGDLGKQISFVVSGSMTGLEAISKSSTATTAVTAATSGNSGSSGGGGGGGGGGFTAIPVVALPALATPLPVGKKLALLDSEGKELSLVAKIEDSGKKLALSGSGWTLDLSADSGLQVSEDGQAEIESGSSIQLGATGYEPDSTVYFYLVPQSYLQAAALGFKSFVVNTVPIELGSTTVSQDGSFEYLAKPVASTGSYLLQISGTNSDGDVANIAISANLTGIAATNDTLSAWTKKLNSSVAKIYAKNVVGGGKVQMYFNGKEIAWVNALDEADPKLRNSSGFSYLVRTVNLVAGRKNTLEIWVDGVRVKRVAYSR